MMVARNVTTLFITGALATGCATVSSHTAPVATAPAPVYEPADPPADRKLIPFLGRWNVAATVYPSASDEPQRYTGVSSFAPANDGRSLRERLNLDGFESESLLGFSPARGRYELSQVDNSTGGQVWMVGLWSADGKTLELEPAESGQLDGLGFAEMRWSYAFSQKGELVKTIRVRDEAGGLWRTQSVYVYSRR